MLAILVYLVAVGLPAYLLFHFRPIPWYWHLLAVAGAVALGFVPVPPDFQRRGFDLLLGFAIVALLIWGFGGLMLGHRRRERHA